MVIFDEVEKTSTEELEVLKAMAIDKERELLGMRSKMDLSDFSTSQLKAELRRRKGERRNKR